MIFGLLKQKLAFFRCLSGRGTSSGQAPESGCRLLITMERQAVTFLVYAMSIDSFGPCSFAPGPITPQTTRQASGNMSPSIFIRGMVHPHPAKPGSLPKTARLAELTAASRHGVNSGPCHPDTAILTSTDTLAPQGGSFSSASFKAATGASCSTGEEALKQSLSSSWVAILVMLSPTQGVLPAQAQLMKAPSNLP